MLILHRLFEFHLPVDEMVNIYILFIRSLLEYCCVVWHSSITEEDIASLERVQKTALRIILKDRYSDYLSALNQTGLNTLKGRRTQISLKFANNCVQSDRNAKMFPLNVKKINTRPNEKYYVTPAHTERLASSTIPYLQKLLNLL